MHNIVLNPAKKVRRSRPGPAFRRAVAARLQGQGGFTMMELIVVILITTIIAVAILMTFSTLTGAFNSQTARIQNQDDARLAINQMARYIRMATSSADNMTSVSNAVATAAPQDIEFYCDVDGDWVAEKVRYYVSDGTLLMQTADPVSIADEPYYEYPVYETDGIVVQDAIQNGTEPVFVYYYCDDDGALQQFTPLSETDLQEVVTVSISLAVNTRPSAVKGSVEVATQVQIRQRYEGGLTE
jgi:prepilin-type N-terminal cleavage/methylation domain-containing protein